MRWIGIVVILFYLTISAKGQEIWTGLNLGFAVSERVKLESKNQFRMESVWDEWEQLLTQVGVKYKVHKKISIRGFYRFTVDNGENNRNRYGGDLLYGSNIGDSKFKFSYRLRYQYSTRKDEVLKTKSVVRNKFGITYKFNKLLKPYVSTEHFVVLNDDDPNSIRLTLGAQTKLSDVTSLSTFYRLENDEEVFSIIGLILRVKLSKSMFIESESIDD